MDLITAVVEIQASTAVIIVAVFVIVFVLVAAAAWAITSNTKVQASRDAGWRVSTDIRLPVSKSLFDRLAAAGARAASRPSPTPEQRQFAAGLGAARKILERGYRGGLIAGGVIGLVLSVLIYLDAYDSDMILLPVGILVLVSLGVLLSGLVPSRVVDPIDPIDPDLLKNIQISAGTQHVAIRLDDTSARTALELFNRGMTAEQVVRVLSPAFDQLSDAEKQQLIRAITMLR